MEFPKRTDSHITETSSWKIFSNCVPNEWIIRDVKESDYGIDAYIEIVSPKGEVSGELCSVQLKGSDNIKWIEDSNNNTLKARFDGIKKTTVNYWFHLPVPVFIVWTDISTGKAYFAAVKDQIRQQYSKYCNYSQKSLGFNFKKQYELGTQLGNLLFIAFYFKEKRFDQFSGYLRGLLTHWQEYYDFIIENQNRDVFMEVDVERQLIMIHIYKSCRFISEFLGIKWNVVDLSELYEKDKEEWKDKFVDLHEISLDRVLAELQPVFIETIEKAKILVAEKQHDYWIATDWLLFTMCSNMNTDYLKNK